MKNKVIRKVLVYGISIVLVAAVVGGVMALKTAKEQTELEATYVDPLPVMTQEEMEALYDAHKVEDTTEIEETVEEVEEVPEETDDRVYEGCPIDFAGMWEINEDVYAWITIPGTIIDYPILQHETDNTYYLNYNIDGSYGHPGCIYTENLNSKDFTDNNTVIYGHNLKSGLMFTSLHKFEDASFFEEHSEIYIYTPEKEYVYTIFAAYVYDDRHLLYSFDFNNPQVYANYLEDIQNMRSMNALFREGITVTAEDKIITLATCMNRQPDKRLLVQAVLNKDESIAQE